jgi:hypothetical protein
VKNEKKTTAPQAQETPDILHYFVDEAGDPAICSKAQRGRHRICPMSFFPSNPSSIPEPEEMRRFLEGRVAVAKSAVGSARNVEELKAVTARMLDELAGLFAEGMIRTRASIACSAGCSYCCCLKVDVFPAEAFLLADYVKRNCSEEVRNAVLVKAGQHSRAPSTDQTDAGRSGF